MKIKLVGIIICILLISTAIPVIGQVSNKIIINNTNIVINPLLNNKWIKTFNLNYEDGGGSVQQTPDGGYIILGGTHYKRITPEIDDMDYWLIKTDSQGNMLWDKVFGGEKLDYAQEIKITSDGGYIIIGHTQSYGAGENDVWMIKTDSNGNMIWNKIFGGIYDDYGMGIEQTDDGGYIIVGEKGVSEAQKQDAWLIKTDELGNMVWNRTYGYSGSDSGRDLVNTLDGGYVVTGSIYWVEGSLMDVWLFKTDSMGELLWEKTFCEDTPSCGYSVDLTDDEGYILTGENPYFDPNSNAFLIKTDSEGELLWEKEFGEGNEYVGLDVHQTTDDGYIIIGGMNLRFSNKNGSDGFLIKTDSEGVEEWTRVYGNRFFPNCVNRGDQISDGGYILVGWTWTHIMPFPFYDSIMDLVLIKTDSNGNSPRNINNRYNVDLHQEHSSGISPLWLRFLDMFPILERILGLLH